MIPVFPNHPEMPGWGLISFTPRGNPRHRDQRAPFIKIGFLRPLFHDDGRPALSRVRDVRDDEIRDGVAPSQGERGEGEGEALEFHFAET